MSFTKKKVWRGFKLKRFLIHVAILFPFLLIVDFIFSQADKNDPYNFFTIKEIIKNLFVALVLGFLFTLWSNPAEKEKVE